MKWVQGRKGERERERARQSQIPAPVFIYFIFFILPLHFSSIIIIQDSQGSTPWPQMIFTFPEDDECCGLSHIATHCTVAAAAAAGVREREIEIE